MSQTPIEDIWTEGPESPLGGKGAGNRRPATEPPQPGSEDPPVEDQLKRLEAIVQKLESEAVSLDESIALFEEGVDLAVRVRRRLEASEGRIKQIIERSEGLFSLEDFDLE